MSETLNRRDFIKLLGGGIIVLVAVGDAEWLAQEPARLQGGGRSLPSDFNAFLRIGEDGRVTCFTGKIEQGQGAISALPLMLAEELEVSRPPRSTWSWATPISAPTTWGRSARSASARSGRRCGRPRPRPGRS